MFIKSKKILLIDSVDSILVDMLKLAGYEITDATKLSRSEILQTIHIYHGIVLRSRIFIDKEFIDSAINIKFIARVGSGMESIDVDYCSYKGIICLNSPEGNRDAVAEHAIAMLLSLLTNLCKANYEVKQGLWLREANRGSELSYKTVAIIGYGNTGSAFASKLSGFNTRILVYDKYKSNFSNANCKIEETDMSTIFAEADVLSLHLPLNKETTYLVDDKFISSFHKPFIFLNTSRGEIVNTQELVKAMQTKKIIAAGLDVIEYEEFSFEKTSNMLQEPNFQYLANNNNVILSPHIAGWTIESKFKLAKTLADKILALDN